MVKKKDELLIKDSEETSFSGEMTSTDFLGDPDYPYEPLEPVSNELKEVKVKEIPKEIPAKFIDSGSFAMKGPERVPEVQEPPRIPVRVTLYQAYRRQYFSDDPSENLAIYNQKRRGYEGKEKTVLISMMIRQI